MSGAAGLGVVAAGERWRAEANLLEAQLRDESLTPPPDGDDERQPTGEHQPGDGPPRVRFAPLLRREPRSRIREHPLTQYDRAGLGALERDDAAAVHLLG